MAAGDISEGTMTEETTTPDGDRDAWAGAAQNWANNVLGVLDGAARRLRTAPGLLTEGGGEDPDAARDSAAMLAELLKAQRDLATASERLWQMIETFGPDRRV